jgi:hypothetical protein
MGRCSSEDAMKIIGIVLGGLAVVVLGGLVIVDVTSTPTASAGQCILARRIVLPDICVNSCSPPFDCTRTTRPYGFFFTQAATCMDGVIC